jgi:hypothetical protein
MSRIVSSASGKVSYRGIQDSSYFVDLERLNSRTALKLCKATQGHSRGGSNEHQELCLFLLREASQCPPEPGDFGVAVFPTVKSDEAYREGQWSEVAGRYKRSPSLLSRVLQLVNVDLGDSRNQHCVDRIVSTRTPSQTTRSVTHVRADPDQRPKSVCGE